MNNLSDRTKQDYINKKSSEIFKYDDYYDDTITKPVSKLSDKKYSNSFWYNIRHRNDELLNTGFDYREQILMRTLSPIIYFDEKRANILQKIDYLFCWMVDYIKSIKRTYNFTVDRDYRNFN